MNESTNCKQASNQATILPTNQPTNPNNALQIILSFSSTTYEISQKLIAFLYLAHKFFAPTLSSALSSSARPS